MRKLWFLISAEIVTVAVKPGRLLQARASVSDLSVLPVLQVNPRLAVSCLLNCRVNSFSHPPEDVQNVHTFTRTPDFGLIKP
jgi:hypothetical protein